MLWVGRGTLATESNYTVGWIFTCKELGGEGGELSPPYVLSMWDKCLGCFLF